MYILILLFLFFMNRMGAHQDDELCIIRPLSNNSLRWVINSFSYVGTK